MANRPWSWNDKALARFVAAARVGDLHAILDVPPEGDLRTALHRAGARKYKHGWEPLLALHVAQDYFRHEMDGILYDYAELRFLRNDDDGYMQQRLAVDLGVLHSVDSFGLHDGQLAYGWWRPPCRARIRKGRRRSSRGSILSSMSRPALCSRP